MSASKQGHADAERASKAELDRAFEELYRTHLRDVYSYAYYRVGNHHDAEDLTEQAFLQAYKHFERARRESNGRPLRPWLIRIAHNLAANYYRDRSRRPVTQLDDAAVLSAPHGTEEMVEGREEVKEVLRGVSELPDDRREALIMRFALDMDNREIGTSFVKQSTGEFWNPDFAKMAEAMGAGGISVEDPADLGSAFETALAAGTPYVIDVKVNRDTAVPLIGTWHFAPIPQAEPTFGKPLVLS